MPCTCYRHGKDPHPVGCDLNPAPEPDFILNKDERYVVFAALLILTKGVTAVSDKLTFEQMSRARDLVARLEEENFERFQERE